MKILKVINNNVVSACDDKGKEIVVMGKGLGFGKKNGDILDESKIEKKFSMPDESVSRLEEILKDIPYEYAQVANRIIAMVKEKFDMKLSKIIYITLTDHLNFAITRFKKGIEVENALLWEIKRFYQKEFEAGKEALEIIKTIITVQETEFNREIIVSMSVQQLWILLLENLTFDQFENMGAVISRTRLQLMMQYVHAHYSENITLEDIARTANISKSTALHLFQNNLKLTPVKYLINYRLKQAALLLINTEEKIATISNNTGFNNVDHFCRTFKKTYKMTPTDYRNPERAPVS